MTICHVMLRIFPDCLSPSPGCARAPQGLPSCPDYLAFQSEELACPSLVGACLPAPLRTQRPVFPSSVHPFQGPCYAARPRAFPPDSEVPVSRGSRLGPTNLGPNLCGLRQVPQPLSFTCVLRETGRKAPTPQDCWDKWGRKALASRTEIEGKGLSG